MQDSDRNKKLALLVKKLADNETHDRAMKEIDRIIEDACSHISIKKSNGKPRAKKK